MNEQGMNRSAAKVQQALLELGVSTTVRQMPASTRTAKEAAQAVGCSVAEIAKSLVFRAVKSDRALLVITSGVNRVNETVLAEIAGEPIERATPQFVRATTGYAIGGVPPVGHGQTMPIWIDRDLFQYERIWAAAGTPFAVFEIAPGELQRVTAAVVADVK
jgi:prolyl-tRNA editing enzyme YbaK/EbsC (Cys-tRNA(Pro) deacylase)